MLSPNQIFSDMPYTGSYFMTLVDNQPLQVEPVGYIYDVYAQTPSGFVWRIGGAEEREVFAYLDKGVPDLETLTYINPVRANDTLPAVEAAFVYGRNDRVMEEVKGMLRSVCIVDLAA